ncbi:MAG: hypothetical protein LDL24_12130 [Treponema sp.]|nr:hypothetical protein [Treponema sp.]
MKLYRFFFVYFLLTVYLLTPVFSQNRSIQTLYPDLQKDKLILFSTEDGSLEILEGSKQKTQFEPKLEPPFGFKDIIQQGKPTFVIETVRLLPLSKPVSISRIYAALSRIRDLAGRTYQSASRGKEVPLFETASRIESLKRTNPVQDPVFPNNENIKIPTSDSFYISLKDINFGNSFYKVDMRTYDKGFLFILSNAKSLSYGIIPVIGENKFISILYVEPLTEGLLLYNQAGAQVGSLISSQVHMPSAIRKRLDVFIDWFLDGLGQ